MTPSEKTKFKMEAQSRMMSVDVGVLENRFNSDCFVRGYAAKFNEYLLYGNDEWGNVYERFEPSCFNDTDMSDIILQYDHAGRVYARNTNDTLSVSVDETGLYVEADLSKTEGARGLYEDISAGMIQKMSWRFSIGEYHVEEKAGSNDITIVHTKVKKIYDVSAVSIPANDATEINARDFVNGVIDGINARRDAEKELEERKRKLLLRIKIEETKRKTMEVKL